MSYTDEECNEIIELVREKNISDYEGQIAFAEKKGREEGEHIKAVEVAIKLKAINIPLSQIAEATNLSIEEIEKL